MGAVIELEVGRDPCSDNPLTRFANLVANRVLEKLSEFSISFDTRWLNPQFVKRVLEGIGFECVEMELGVSRVLISCRGMKNKADKSDQR